MSDWATDRQDRVNFLNVKARTIGLTPEERAEMDGLVSTRVVTTSGGGPILVLPAEESVSEWKAKIAERNEAERQRRERNEQ